MPTDYEVALEISIDGMVELDDRDVIVRANDAFCRTVDLPRLAVEGQPWSSLAASLDCDETFEDHVRNGDRDLRIGSSRCENENSAWEA
jgi:PAS domain-containing protein